MVSHAVISCVLNIEVSSFQGFRIGALLYTEVSSHQGVGITVSKFQNYR